MLASAYRAIQNGSTRFVWSMRTADCFLSPSELCAVGGAGAELTAETAIPKIKPIWQRPGKGMASVNSHAAVTPSGKQRAEYLNKHNADNVAGSDYNSGSKSDGNITPSGDLSSGKLSYKFLVYSAMQGAFRLPDPPTAPTQNLCRLTERYKTAVRDLFGQCVLPIAF